MFYEYHMFSDEKLKIIYHTDHLKKEGEVGMHLHKNVEILLMNKGSARIFSDNDIAVISEGQLAVIAPNHLHRIESVSEKCQYGCLIIDHSVYEEWFSKKEIRFPFMCDDAEIAGIYSRIFSAMEAKKPYYRQEVKALLMLMLSLVFRCMGTEDAPKTEQNNRKLNMVRSAIEYMYQNFANDISVDDICGAIGFSKYYFCRCFKEITGQTPLWHLNYIRCQTARVLLKSGNTSITECALKCGFNNTSYFCKIYKKYFKKQPKEDSRSAQSS